MNNHQRLFLVQAKTDFAVFQIYFKKRTEFPAWHALHSLQMATEMFGKANAWKHGLKKKIASRRIGKERLQALTS